MVAARLAFVVVFQFLVYSITSLIAWVVPDVPENLKFKQERERQLVKEKLGAPSDDDDSGEDGENDADKTTDDVALVSAI